MKFVVKRKQKVEPTEAQKQWHKKFKIYAYISGYHEEIYVWFGMVERKLVKDILADWLGDYGWHWEYRLPETKKN